MSEEQHYEKYDVNSRGVLIFAGVLAGGIAISCVVVACMMGFLASHPPSPIQSSRIGLPALTPPAPVLQIQPSEDLKIYQEKEIQILSTYAWNDRGKGVVRIPIEVAMKWIVERGPSPSPSGLTPLDMQRQKALEDKK